MPRWLSVIYGKEELHYLSHIFSKEDIRVDLKKAKTWAMNGEQWEMSGKW